MGRDAFCATLLQRRRFPWLERALAVVSLHSGEYICVRFRKHHVRSICEEIRHGKARLPVTYFSSQGCTRSFGPVRVEMLPSELGVVAHLVPTVATCQILPVQRPAAALFLVYFLSFHSWSRISVLEGRGALERLPFGISPADRAAGSAVGGATCQFSLGSLDKQRLNFACILAIDANLGEPRKIS